MAGWFEKVTGAQTPDMFSGGDKFMNRQGLSMDQQKPWQIGVGGTKFDMSDPRMIAALALAPGTGGASLAYGMGTEYETQRREKKLERDYAPKMDTARQLAAQQQAVGGTQGGYGAGQEQNSVDQILQELIGRQRGVRQQMSAQDAQLLGILGAAFGYSMGGPAGGQAGYAGGQFLGSGMGGRTY